MNVCFVCGAQLVFANVIEPSSFVVNADKFICSVLPESPSKVVSYSRGASSLNSILSFILHVA